MIENRPFFTALSHFVLILGVALTAFPIWITFVASTHEAVRMGQAPIPLWPGDQFFVNLKAVFFGTGLTTSSRFTSDYCDYFNFLFFLSFLLC